MCVFDKMHVTSFLVHILQVRVVQGKEPAHFMSMFDGKMIIFSVSV